jgi:high-affinity iron transporter
MAQAFLITLREGLEMALIVVVVLAYLKRTGYIRLFNRVWQGVALATGVSLLGGAVLFGLGKGLEGRAEQVFEGTTMLLAAAVLSWMIIWMKTQSRHIRGYLETQMEQAVAGGSTLALVAIPFLAVGREGLETALFLFSASKTATPAETIIGGLLGLAVAILMGWFLYRGARVINLRKFFSGTGVLLIVFAAGLIAHGIHEFQEAGYLPMFIEHVWDMNSFLDENSTFGSFLKGIFGYNGNPSLLEVVAYPLYLGVALFYFLRPAIDLARRSSPQPATGSDPS